MIPWKTYEVSFQVIRGPKCYKRVGGGKIRAHWRNYRREVPGGVDFVERFSLACDEQEDKLASYLSDSLWSHESR